MSLAAYVAQTPSPRPLLLNSQWSLAAFGVMLPCSLGSFAADCATGARLIRPAHHGDGERIDMGLRPMLSRALPCTHWSLTAPDPGVIANTLRFNESGAGRSPAPSGRSPQQTFPRPRLRGRMSHAPVAHRVANEANEQGSVTPKAAGDLCELRGAAQRARGLRGRGAYCLASLTHVFSLMPLPSGEGKSSPFDAMPQPSVMNLIFLPAR